MADRKSIEARIAELRGELASAEGTPTEVYSRIVGYYRSVRNWNAGKREEYRERLAFSMPEAPPAGSKPTAASKGAARAETAVEAEPVVEPSRSNVELRVRSNVELRARGNVDLRARNEVEVRADTVPGASAVVNLSGDASLRDGILVFTREACPNCSPVANYVISSGMKAVFVDVDREEGLALARNLGVMATPTVLGLDGEGRESFRAFDLPGLRSRVEAR